ncbi:MAG: DUF1254 domain-containing protein [Burkholderiaceae bacterium]
MTDPVITPPDIADHPELPYLRGLALEAIIYAWPLYEMQRMRSATSPRRIAGQGFAGDSPESLLRWCNCFVHERELLRAGTSRVVMPNNDTLYANAWFDLSEGPLVLDLPETGSRYYVLGLLDFYTNPFGHVGTRTTGNGAGQVLLSPPGWRGDVPPECRAPGRHLRSPTRWVWQIGRLLVDGADDLAAVHALQDAMSVHRLQDWQAGRRDGAARRFDARHEPREPFEPARFLARVGEALLENPPPAGDAALLAQWRRIGLGLAEAERDALLARPLLAHALALAGADAQRLLDMPAERLGHDERRHGWIPSMMTLGDGFGDDLLLRAFIARQGIGALAPQEAIYPRCDTDAQARQLEGGSAYRLRFAPGQLPPVNAFWSLTLYDSRDKMLVDNVIDRYSIGDRTPGLVYDDDGGLTLHVQHLPPATPAARANWLPAPEGEFFLCLRAYMPEPAMLDGSYRLPPPQRITS